MAEGELAPLNEGVERRRRGLEPTDEQMQLARKSQWKHLLPDGTVDLRCWNGKSRKNPDCNWVGSQNIPFYSWAVLGNWSAIAECCRVEAREGNFGRENGSISSFYHGGVVGVKLDAERELTKAGRYRDAADVKLAIRSNLAWSAIAAVPAPRLRDEVNEAGKWRRTENPPLGRRLMAPVAGMRWSTKGRSKMTSEDSPSETLANELASPDEFGLTLSEAATMRRCIAGDVEAAREVASWMFGTIDTGDTTWRWRFRRTTLGGEVVFLGQHPNGMKPMRVVTQAKLDGTWTGMRPSPEKQTNDWADGFEVEVEGGMIRSRCVAGKAEIPELGGEILWQVDVVGQQVSFQPGGGPAQTLTPPASDPSLPQPPAPPVEPPVTPPVTVPSTTPPAPEEPSLKQEFLRDLQGLAPKYIGRAGLDPALEAALRLIASGAPIDIRSLLVTLLISGVGR